MKREPSQILVVDDEPNMRKVIKAMLMQDGYDVQDARDGADALEILAENHIDIVISDLKMPKVDGMTLLKAVMEKYDLPVIMITAHGTIDNAVEALKLGAFDYITKPFERSELQTIVAKAARMRELSSKEATIERDNTGRFRMIGRSEPMEQIFEVVDRVADTPSTVLITGESGTGKELIVRALHEYSSRRNGAYIRVNCAAIPPTLIESELFGYEKGAFTGAGTSKPGRFELAHGGTLFLDEIGEISLEMQVKLLRAIQEGEFERVGGISTSKVDVRLVTATNQDLRQRIADGLFRDDLFYRLNVVHIHLPPLRERQADIPLLVSHFLDKYNKKFNKQVEGVDEEAQNSLCLYQWPGNIRELENVVERCVLFCDNDHVTYRDLPPDFTDDDVRHSFVALEGAKNLNTEGGLKDKVKAVTISLERELITRALDQTGRNVTRAAQILKISRKSLQTKMKELGLRDDPADSFAPKT